jgi:hypothetical protein
MEIYSIHIENMASDDESISVCVRLRPKNQFKTNADNDCKCETYVKPSKVSLKTRFTQFVKHLIISFIEIMRQKSKQICFTLALIITLLAAIQNRFVFTIVLIFNY